MINYSQLKEKLNPARDGQDVLQLRVGTVTAWGTSGKVTVTMASGVTVTDVPYLTGAGITIGSVVQMVVYRGSLLIIGSVAGTNQAVGGKWVTELANDGGAETSATGFAYMSMTLPAAGTYAFRIHWLFTIATNTAAPGFALGGTAPPSSYRWASQVIPAGSATGMQGSQGNGTTSYPTNVSTISGLLAVQASVFGSILVQGRVTVTAGGTLTFRIGRQAGTGSITVRQSSNAHISWVNPP